MVWWDRELEDKLVRIGLKLWTYKRYVDDISNIMTPPKLGVRFDGDKLIEDERSVEEDQVLDVDERTMRLFQSVANSIHPSIEVEIDCPSRHHDGKLPILELKVWIEKRIRDGESQGENRVLHEYYSKEISSAYAINARSALSWRSKRTILTQEVLRVLLNCSVELPWQVLFKHVNHMMMRLQYSGYDQKFRTEVVKSALNAYKHILRLDACGEKPMYRTRTWRKIEIVREKRKKREGWYRKGGYDSVIFVPATPGSELKRRYEKEVDEEGMKIRVTCTAQSCRPCHQLANCTDLPGTYSFSCHTGFQGDGVISCQNTCAHTQCGISFIWWDIQSFFVHKICSSK